VIIPVAQYPFRGPYRSAEKIEEAPGLFLVISEYNGKHYLLDIGHSDEVKKAIQNHERRGCWEKYRKGLIRYAVLYTEDLGSDGRRKLEEKIRKIYRNIPCGGSPDG